MGKGPRLESQVQVLYLKKDSVFVLDKDTRTKVSESIENLIPQGPNYKGTRVWTRHFVIRLLYCLVIVDALVGL
jgi:hypothetical protein